MARALEHGDVPFRALVIGMALLVLALVAAIGYELWRNSDLSRQAFGWQFLFTSNWDPVAREFGALPFWYGTLVTSMVALILALPVSLGIAIFGRVGARLLRTPLGFLVELLAAVPSVVYGLWGLFVFVPNVVKPSAQVLNKLFGALPIFEGPVFGPSRLAAAAILAIMITPTISAVSRDVFPPSRAQRYGARARPRLDDRAGAHSLRAVRHPGRCHPGVGSRVGRDDGRDDGDRQQPRPLGLAAASGLHDGVHHRQRVH
jgi:ABC-type phosphate transport system permease subunit